MQSPLAYVLIICLLVAGLAVPPSRAQEMVTNEKLYAMLGNQAHSLMRDQRQRLRQILEGFLSGDWTRIQRALHRMNQDIDKIASQYKPVLGKEDDRINAIMAIKEHAKMLEHEAAQGNFEASFSHFTAMTQQCVQCHQAQRQWGVFTEERVEDKSADHDSDESENGMPEVEGSVSEESESDGVQVNVSYE
ncbi:MAG: hypothetical protein Q8R76_06945 [Candidatus Omnitrophota bacterium]|nr:hypothetical protein [Candidatus Omnitrophota bacterium]